MLNGRFSLTHVLVMVVLLMGFIMGCESDEPATPVPTAAVPVVEATATSTSSVQAVPPTAQAETVLTPEQTATILISEVLPGLPGANNSEFVELYNTGAATADLQGWSLWYSLNGDDGFADGVYYGL